MRGATERLGLQLTASPARRAATLPSVNSERLIPEASRIWLSSALRASRMRSLPARSTKLTCGASHATSGVK